MIKLISACLCGINCKYNGGNNLHPHFKELYDKGLVYPVCPEQLAGLPTPRAASEIVGGNGTDVLEGKARVVTKTGKDITDYFIKGAQKTLQIAEEIGADMAILQSRSPSCGVGHIYDGTFSSKIISGDGVCAALLKKRGLAVINDKDYLNNKEETR